MLNLTNIRKSFVPNVPIRWSVSFSNTAMNIVGNDFTAKDVSYTALHVGTMEVPIAPGISIPVNTIQVPITGIDISFYDNDKKQVLAALKTLVAANLANGNGGFNKASDNFKVTITEYDNTLSVAEQNIFLVQLEGDVYSKFLVQDAVPYESKLKLIVVGTG